ncbi:MAG: hypothetical protein K2Y23_23610, partial [Cyanobacteria bacterium]|nr:hypothetical protein [Cyanobacteriota bacterium]
HENEERTTKNSNSVTKPSTESDQAYKRFFENYSRDIHEKILGMGTTFTDMEEQPERLFTENGYTTVSIESITMYAAERTNPGISALALQYFLRTVRDGYVIAVFRR